MRYKCLECKQEHGSSNVAPVCCQCFARLRQELDEAKKEIERMSLVLRRTRNLPFRDFPDPLLDRVEAIEQERDEARAALSESAKMETKALKERDAARAEAAMKDEVLDYIAEALIPTGDKYEWRGTDPLYEYIHDAKSKDASPWLAEKLNQAREEGRREVHG